MTFLVLSVCVIALGVAWLFLAGLPTQLGNRIKLRLALGSSFDAAPAAGGGPPPQGSVSSGLELAGAYGHGKWGSL